VKIKKDFGLATVLKLKALLLDSIYPPRCPVCHEIAKAGRSICKDCLPLMDFVKGAVCLKCGKELYDESQDSCSDCAALPKSFEYGLALLNYDDISSESMIKIKYKNKREYIKIYARLIALKYRTEIKKMEAEALIPVPVHKNRLKIRGYNQSELLARYLSQETGIKLINNALVRVRDTRAQKALTSEERFKNLSEAFCCDKLPENLHNIIIVDDIYTTGSTMEACTRVLKRAGAEKVYCISICIGKGTY